MTKNYLLQQYFKKIQDRNTEGLTTDQIIQLLLDSKLGDLIEAADLQRLFFLISGVLVLNQSSLVNAKTIFTQHYKTDASPGDFYPVYIPWTDFYNAADNFIKNNIGISFVNLGVFLIHRYDTNNNQWFLTAQFCGLKSMPINFPTGNVITSSSVIALVNNYIDITVSGGSDPYTESDQIVITNGYPLGTDYFGAVQYSSDGVNFHWLDQINNVKACIMPWREIQEMHDNNSNDDSGAARNDNDMRVIFSSISSDYSDAMSGAMPPPVVIRSNVTFPHGIAVNMNYMGTDLLDDGSVIAGNFRNKSCDYQSLCPPNCGVYYWPSDLGVILSNFFL